MFLRSSVLITSTPTEHLANLKYLLVKPGAGREEIKPTTPNLCQIFFGSDEQGYAKTIFLLLKHIFVYLFKDTHIIYIWRTKVIFLQVSPNYFIIVIESENFNMQQ